MAKQLDRTLGANPANGFFRSGKQREFEPWPDWVVDAFAEAIEQFQVLSRPNLGTGQSSGTAVTIRRYQLRGEWMIVRNGKGNVDIEVYYPQPLRKFIDDLRIEGRHLLPEKLTEPLTYHAVEKKFGAWKRSLGPKAK